MATTSQGTQRLQLYRASHARLQDFWSKLAGAVREFKENSAAAKGEEEEEARRNFESTLTEIFPFSLHQRSPCTFPVTVEHAITLSIHALCVMGSHLDNQGSSDPNDSASVGSKRVPPASSITPGLGYTCTGSGEGNELMPSLPSGRQSRNNRNVQQQAAQGSSSRVVSFMAEYGKYLPPGGFEMDEHTYAATYELNREAANIKLKIVRPAMANFLMMHVSVHRSSAVDQSVRSVQVSSSASCVDKHVETVERTDLLSLDGLQEVADTLNTNVEDIQGRISRLHAIIYFIKPHWLY
eukprot:gb/GECG01012827.1/.p1 GENE.gb/GECG01012827.1/~~gb/GECG01012827.1/.p1  ORF type:complete len:296 (+),score=36.23 gb/GECG01012827.1/:1-888(+)